MQQLKDVNAILSQTACQQLGGLSLHLLKLDVDLFNLISDVLCHCHQLPDLNL